MLVLTIEEVLNRLRPGKIPWILDAHEYGKSLSGRSHGSSHYMVLVFASWLNLDYRPRLTIVDGLKAIGEDLPTDLKLIMRQRGKLR